MNRHWSHESWTEIENRFWYLRGGIYAEHAAGGNCHIILDDYNVDDDSLQVCREANSRNDAKVGWIGQNTECQILDLLSTLTIEERRALVRGEIIRTTCENDNELS